MAVRSAVRAILLTAVLALGSPASAAAPDAEEVRAAADRAAGYLLRSSLPDGRFVYLRQLDGGPHPESGHYNLLRHAGTMYALERYYDLTGDARVPPILERAATELESHIAPLPKAPWTSAVWTDPQRLGGGEKGSSYAKLGGSGLALVALSPLQARAPDPDRLQTLRALARFLGFMQRSDGRFRSRYRPESGFDDSWSSLYYPGEAALGLLSLHAVDPDPTWLRTAGLGLRFLVESRDDDEDVPPDHWVLIATARYLAQADPPEDIRAPLLSHTARIARRLMADAPSNPSEPFLDGALGPHGRVTPTATRLEGLFAARLVLTDQPELEAQMRSACNAGVAFLLRAQVRGGEMDGAFPALAGPIRKPRDARERALDAHPGEVRVDYVQHALTALIDQLESATHVAGRWKSGERR